MALPHITLNVKREYLTFMKLQNSALLRRTFDQFSKIFKRPLPWILPWIVIEAFNFLVDIVDTFDATPILSYVAQRNEVFH